MAGSDSDDSRTGSVSGVARLTYRELTTRLGINANSARVKARRRS